jgi:endo-1,4-beta-xylanase
MPLRVPPHPFQLACLAVSLAAAIPGRAATAESGATTTLADDWRQEANLRIERHRKADLVVSVEDSTGAPIRGAMVDVALKRHAFGFGALIGTSRWEGRPNGEDARRHLELVAERFNKVVTILKPGEPAADAALDWLAARDIRVRGHYLMWAPVQPARGRLGQPADAFRLPVRELVGTTDAAQLERIREAAFDHLERVLSFAGRRVAEWDAVNHIAHAAGVRYSDVLGPRIYADILLRARELAPHAEMWVNEGSVLTSGSRLEKYHDVIRQLIALGAKPDGIGFMAHFREGGLTPPEEVYRRLDRFAALVPNLQLTELDIDTADEQLQAGYMRDILTVAFSHPAVSGIVMWQVWGVGAEHKALWRPDWSIKPAGQVWLDHVFQRWWTSAKGTTDERGVFSTRGFLGDYELTVRVGDRRQTVPARLTSGGGRQRIVF